MAEGRRIIYDDEDREMYDNLINSSTPFKKMSIIEVFAMALVYGKEVGLRKRLGEGATGRVRESTINSSDIRYLMMAIAADENHSIDVLAEDISRRDLRYAVLFYKSFGLSAFTCTRRPQ